MQSRTALVTGIAGQDGSYLAELLLEKGYRVCGLDRCASGPSSQYIEHLRDRIEVFIGDMLDQTSVTEILKQVRPDEVYNLAAQSSVGASWSRPILTCEITGLGVLHLLEPLRVICPQARFCQASSSEMFGKACETPQQETTPFHPRSPYGVAKTFGHHITVSYRESYGMFGCSAILFNHESPRRGMEFVTRKITSAVARIKLGLDVEVRLGNLNTKRDWGFAGDYVRAMWLMLQQDSPGDYVVGSGEAHSVREFAELAFDHVGLDWRDHTVVDPKFYRPAEVDLLLADPSKARKHLGWRPEVDFPSLVALMVDEDLRRLKESPEAAECLTKPKPRRVA
jgi:GDPmannose 4,6-dehydratase